MRILFDTRWQGPQGIARFGREVYRRLPGVEPLKNAPRLFSPIDPLWLTWTLRRKRPDVYFTPGFNPPARTSTPFIMTIHDLNYIHSRQYYDSLRYAYFQWLVRPACRRASRVLTVSEFSRRQIVEWAHISEDRVINVGNGVDGSFTPNGPRHQPGYPYILYVGNRLPHKNLPRLIEAFARAKLNCKLVLTGRSDRKLLEIAAKHGCGDGIAFAGAVADDALPALYRGALAVALPSLSEGFGLPIVEAMACGVPVLASNAGALPEVAGDAALAFNAELVDEIAHAIGRVVQDSELRATLIQSGAVRASLFSWEKTASLISAAMSDGCRDG